MLNLVIIGAAFAKMVIGAFWYSPTLFGNMWMKEMKFKKKDIPKMKAEAKKGYIASAISALVMAGVMDWVLTRFGASNAWHGITIALILWLGLHLTTDVGEAFWGKNVKLGMIDAGHHLVGLAVMCAILSVW